MARKKIDAPADLYKLHGRTMDSVIEHGKAAGVMWRAAETVHDNHRIEFDPVTFLFAWRNKRQLVSVMARAAKALMAAVDEAPLIEAWRSSTVKNEKIVREVMALLHEKNSVTVAEVEAKCQDFSTRETVRSCLNLGVEQTVLEKKNGHYEVSDNLTREMTDRVSIKMCDAHIREMSEIITAYNTMRSFMFKTHELEKDAQLPQDSPPTIHESIHYRGLKDDGQYGDE